MRDKGRDFHWRRAWLRDRHHRQVSILNVFTLGARPFFHGCGRACIGYLGLQGSLGLDGLGGLRVHEFILSVEQFKFFKAPVEFKDDERKDNDEKDSCDAAQIDWKVEHSLILIVLEVSDKRL